MQKKNWRHIGAVVVDDRNAMRAFDNFQDAIRSKGRERCLALTYGVKSKYSLFRIGSIEREWPVLSRDEFVFRDEHGLIIPPWRVHEEVRSMDWPHLRRRYRREIREEDFRRAPVPGVGFRHLWTHRLRYMATQQERGENDWLDYDEDAIDHRIRARPNRRYLPTVWDEKYRGMYKTWKAFRRHQYRERETSRG